MFKLIGKYMKSSVFSVILVIILLVIQAFSDLKLPDYTSRIVNIGIQQGGIEYSVPESVREEQFNGIISLVTEDNNQIDVTPSKIDKNAFERILLLTNDSSAKSNIKSSYKLNGDYYELDKSVNLSDDIAFGEAAYFLLDSAFANPDILKDLMDKLEVNDVQMGSNTLSSVIDNLQGKTKEENWAYFQSFGKIIINLITKNIQDEIEKNPDIDSDAVKTVAYIWYSKNEKEIGNADGLLSENQKSVLSFYTLKDGIYYLNENADVEKLNSALAKPIAVYGIMDTMINNPEKFSEMGGSMQSSASSPEKSASMDYSEFLNEDTLPIVYKILGLKENSSMLDLIGFLPNSFRNKIVNQITERFGDLTDTIVDQYSVEWIKNEYIAQGIDVNDKQMSFLFSSGFVMLGLAAIVMLANYFKNFFAARISAKFSRDVRADVFNKVIAFSGAEFNKISTASLITRSTNDIQQIQNFINMLLIMVLYAPIIGTGAVIKIMGVEGSLAWIIGAAVVIVFITIGILFAIVGPKFAAMQKLVDRLNLVAREVLTGLPVIRAFTTEDYEKERFDKANTDFMKVNLFVTRTMALMMPLVTLLMSGLSCAIVWFGSKEIDSGSMQVGNLMAYITYAMQIMISFMMIAMASIMLPRAKAAGDRVQEIMDIELSVKNPENPQKFDDEFNGIVEFKNVDFAYPGAEQKVLSDISFKAVPGKTTAIIGGTGSGKSTIVNLIPRLYDCTGGEVIVNGKNVKDVTQHDLREKIGFVTQKAILFSGTINSNLVFGKQDAAENEVEAGADIAQATEFINEKTEKYDYQIAQSGTNVSGGQKQRLAIARAIIKDPEILIFDDSFSALDFKTDKKLRAELADKTKDKTVIIVAQRISTIMNADQILVIDEGEIVGKGTHKELLKECKAYQEIALSQLSEEELKNE